jgi:uncharacterized membrane protein
MKSILFGVAALIFFLLAQGFLRLSFHYLRKREFEAGIWNFIYGVSFSAFMITAALRATAH